MPKSFVLILSLVFSLAAFNSACSRDREPAASAPAASGFRTVTPAEAMKLIKTRKDLMVIDVRSPQELREGAIANSRLIPIWQLSKKFHPDPAQPLLVVCAVGGRSYMAGQYLFRSGVREVYSLKGGIAAWKKAGLPLVYPRS